MDKNILKTYIDCQNINTTAKICGCGRQRVMKTLITAGIPIKSKRAQDVARLRLNGYSDEQIARLLGISIKAVNMYTPYRKCQYKGPNRSQNALAIAFYRQKKREKERNKE